MKIFIASDHAGFELKKALIDHLKSQNVDVEDCGAFEFDQNDDYPDFIYPCSLRVAESHSQGKPGESLGIVIGASGQGEAMVANKVRGIRAAVYYGGDLDLVKRAKDHNNANVLSLGAKFLSEDEAKEAVDLFISEEFPGEERHMRRIKKISKIESIDTN